jgi:hypothetical protein
MATQAAKRNVKKAQESAARKKTITNLPKQTPSALGQQGATGARRKRADGSCPKTPAELSEIAKQRDLPGRSKMAHDELARKLGEE